MTEISAAGNIRRDRYNFIFALFLAVTALLMLLYEVFGVDHFIGYIDGEAYYSYLPEYLLDGNWEHFEKYPIGTAVCELPFFAVAHLLTLLTDPAAADGYTEMYDWSVGISGIFFYVLGTMVLYCVLRRMTGGRRALFVCFLMTIGTALPVYATKYASFSHIKTYALTAILIYLVLRIVEEEDAFRNNFLLGLVAGLLVIIRNINVFFLLFYLLYGFGRGKIWREHLKNVFSLRRLAPNILGGLLMVLPQMILWKIATGDFLCYSYEGEAFTYLANPKLYEVFFSDAKGLLVFSPILIFGIIGLFFLGRVESGKYTAGIVAVFALETYTTAAWWCWWLGGVYSIRSFVDIFPFFAIAMAAFFGWLSERLRERTRAVRIGMELFYGAMLIFFALVNFAFYKGTQTGVVNETMAFWWELREALQQVFVF